MNSKTNSKVVLGHHFDNWCAERSVGGGGGGSINKQWNRAKEWIGQIHINER